MDNKMIFDIFKNIIIEQNKVLLLQVSEKCGIDYETLLEKYLKPEYYLPVILHSQLSKK
jgi:hypothetical protein